GFKRVRDHTFNGQAVFASIAEHGGPILMDKRLARPPKSLADILAEELDEQLGPKYTQELPVAEKQERLKAVYKPKYTQELSIDEKRTRLQAVYKRIHEEQPT